MNRFSEFFSGLKSRHLWILACICASAAFHFLTGCRGVMNALAGFSLRIKQFLALLFSVFPFSFAEFLCTLACAAAFAYIVLTVIDIVRRPKRLRLLYHRFSFALAVCLTVYVLLCVFLGASYYADGFQEKSGLYASEESTQSLYDTTAYFASRLSYLSDKVQRNINGEFDESLDDIFSASPEIYGGVIGEFPFLAQTSATTAPKRIFLSKLMSWFNYTGYYFPFTGEANINVDQPSAFVPSTITHEMAHQHGIASEQEANFVAILACAKSGSNAYDYSGCLMAFINLGNALYEYDPDGYRALYSSLPEDVITDIRVNDAYWEKYNTRAAAASQSVYDGFLKSYGQPLGVRSYGACVDLLITYYCQYGTFERNVEIA